MWSKAEEEWGQTSDMFRPGSEEQEEPVTREQTDTIGKISHYRLIRQRGNQLISKRLPSESTFNFDKYNQIRTLHEGNIRRFIQQNTLKRKLSESLPDDCTPEQDAHEGKYLLNNWISKAEYCCAVVTNWPQILLLYALIDLNFENAKTYLSAMPQSVHVQILQYLIAGYQSIFECIGGDSQLRNIMLNRKTFHITPKTAHGEERHRGLLGSSYFLDLFQEQGVAKFRALSSDDKIYCLSYSMKFLSQFASHCRLDNMNDYLKFSVLFLANAVDQRAEQNPEQYSSHFSFADSPCCEHQTDYFALLLQLQNIRLSDRLNLSMKLLPEKKRIRLALELQNSLYKQFRLQHLLYYCASDKSPQLNQQKMSQICQNYLDLTGDLETVAYLACEYPFLEKYYANYKQALALAFEQKALDKIQNYRREYGKEGHHVTIPSAKLIQVTRTRREPISLFPQINTREEKIDSHQRIVSGGLTCEICCRKVAVDEGYLVCGKCFHGGHVNHVMKWFEEFQNCAKIECPCFCN